MQMSRNGNKNPRWTKAEPILRVISSMVLCAAILGRKEFFWIKEPFDEILFALNESENRYGAAFHYCQRRARSGGREGFEWPLNFADNLPAVKGHCLVSTSLENKLGRKGWGKENKPWILRNSEQNPLSNFDCFCAFLYFPKAFKHHRFECVQLNRHKLLNVYNERKLGRAELFTRFDSLISCVNKLRFGWTMA